LLQKASALELKGPAMVAGPFLFEIDAEAVPMSEDVDLEVSAVDPVGPEAGGLQKTGTDNYRHISTRTLLENGEHLGTCRHSI
jgi:hypothetical protein